MLITPLMVAGEAGRGYNGITETNDKSLTNVAASMPPSTAGATALVGHGDLASPQDGAFFLDPAFQTNTVEFAYLVTDKPIDTVGLQVAVLGEGIIDAGSDGGAAWGPAFGDAAPLSVWLCIPEPSTVVLTTLGLIGLSYYRRRRP